MGRDRWDQEPPPEAECEGEMVYVPLIVGDKVYVVKVLKEDVEAVKELEAMLNGRKAYCSYALRGVEAIKCAGNWEAYETIDRLAAQAIEDGRCVME